MFKLLLFLIVLIKSVVSIPYANNYPYKTIGYSNAASEIAGNGDANRFLKNELSDHGNNIKSAQDNGKFYDSENISKVHDLNHLNKGTSTDVQKHTTGENFENDNSHNRKHIKSGFKNSYHKDESGNNSSFYEDSDDRGEKTIYNKRLGARDDSKDNRFSEGVRDGSARDKYDDRRGGFYNKGTHDRQHLLAENQGNRHGHRDGYAVDQGQRFENYQEPNHHRYPIESNRYGNRHQEYNRPPYVEDYTLAQRHPPSFQSNLDYGADNKDDGYFQPQRITIFEDPRDLIDPRTERRRDYHDGAYHQTSRLEFRPSPLRFHNDFDDNGGRAPSRYY